VIKIFVIDTKIKYKNKLQIKLRWEDGRVRRLNEGKTGGGEQ
jgi:hypothetical protein